MRLLFITLALLTVTVISCRNSNQKSEQLLSHVQIAGAMKNVMMKGELSGIIDLDTITNKDNLYGLGPVEYLTGEITILNGSAYISNVTSDSTMTVTETFEKMAPFFVYQNIPKWKKIILSNPMKTIKDLENQITNATANVKKPFGFRIKGKIESATIHIVNLPKGSKVSSPEQAHKGQINFPISEQNVTVVGFFSKNHKGVFTHHDTNVHMHLITEDKVKMGHLDAVSFKDVHTELYIPVE